VYFVNDWIIPDWPAPATVGALSTTRLGGVSTGPWASLNLGLNSGDEAGDVIRNRRLVDQHLPEPVQYLQQVHGRTAVKHPGSSIGSSIGTTPVQADAQWSDQIHEVCAVLTADCLPVLFCNREGTEVAAAHAGWRGLAAGILESTLGAMSGPAGELLAWMGPAIGPAVYQVGSDVKAAFAQREAEGAKAFVADGDRWLFDLYAMARHCLQSAGVGHISGGGYCTYTDERRFFSYRRDGVCGRMASLVWLKAD
jgi:YfiH family protein